MQHDTVERAWNLDSEILGSKFAQLHSGQDTKNKSFKFSNPQYPHLQREESNPILLYSQCFL